jgi:hypothetical protein
MKSIISRGNLVLESLLKTLIIVVVSSPTETAAYNEWGVRLYSCIDSGLHNKDKVEFSEIKVANPSLNIFLALNTYIRFNILDCRLREPC